MIPLVAPCITDIDRDHMRQTIGFGLLEDGSEVVRLFEKAFASWVGCGWAVAVSSGTVALDAAYMLCGYVDGSFLDPSVPTYGCEALVNAAEVDTRVEYRDSRWDIRNAGMTQDAATVTVHMFGRRTVSEIPLVEDYSLSFGYPMQLRSPIGVCSTHESKMVSTGRGGVVFGDDPELERATREWATRQGVLMAGMQAALGVSQLAQLDQFIARRRELAAYYSDRFDNVGLECPDPDCGSVFFRYIIGVDDPARKVLELAEHGVEAGRGVNPLLHQQFGLPDSDFPGAVEAWSRNLSVPVHPGLSWEQAADVADAVIEVCA